MRKALFNILIGIVCLAPLAAQQTLPASDWRAWQFVIGEWVGEGSGAPGQGSGGFSFIPDLQGRVLVRRNHTEFPASQGRPAAVHEDLMIISQEADKTRAVYWDNEGHVIRYTVEFAADGAIIFISEAQSGAPRFQLSYQKIEAGRLGIRFEIAPPDKPDDFKVYLDGTARKK